MQRKLTEPETELLIAVANGDRAAFATLFYAFHQELGHFILRLTKSKIISEEIVQETFLKVWLNREDLLNIKNFRAYLFTISRNQALNALRDQTKRSFLRGEELSELPLADDQDEINYEKEELFEIVEKAVSQLPPQQQKVWRLSKEEGLSYQKIAERLELSPQTVKRHVSLAMATVMRMVKVGSCSLLPLLLFY